MRILVAEDEKKLAAVISKRLKNESYAVDTVHDGLSALDYLYAADYDVAILDIMMPKLDGLTLLERYRKEGGKCPVIFLSAKDAVSDRIKGLDIGADDYIVKPFSFDELIARIRSVLRRKNQSDDLSNILKIDNLELDIKSGRVMRGKKVIELSNKEFSLLKYMMTNEGAILSRESLMSHVWDYTYEGASNMIDVYIRYLRTKIDTDGERKLIHTYRGRGYSIGIKDES